MCGIVFDAISIKESLHFDKASDSINGREDFGDHGKSFKEANHALVFMVKGLVILFFIVGINTLKIRELYETSISKVQSMGFKVIYSL
ncbi:MAG: hypothetical protein GY777_15180 [Candidatus Brocadiaceae bacterium]|nr:hypothetical protein [Candidatus Brocadiaceae bacterium]